MFDVNAGGSVDARWWITTDESDEATTKRRGQSLQNIVATLYRVQEPLRTFMTVAWRLYTNQPIIGLSPRNYRTRTPGMRSNAPGLNLVKAVTDSYVSLITHDRPKTFFDVAGGDWDLHRKAHHLQIYMDGISYETDFQHTAGDVVRDSAIFGQGVSRTYADYTNEKDPKIRIERVFPWEILCDDSEAVYGKPSCIYQYRYVDRKVLMTLHPDKITEIRLANSSAFVDAPGSTYTDGTFIDQVVVIEGWHLPTVPGTFEEGGTMDGRHTTIVGNCILDDEEYLWDRFPFEFCYRQTPVQGIWGIGIPSELAPTQLEINRLMRTINQSQRLAVGHWLVEQNANVDTNAINNVVASIIRYTGNAPSYVSYPAVQADVYNYLWTLWGKGFEVIGVSELAAMSQIPANIKSGKAMDTYEDVQSNRFKPAYREYERFVLKITEQVMHWSREIQENYPDFEVKTPSSRSMMKTVKWADVGLHDNEFTLKLKPANMLGDDVAERFQNVADMQEQGMIDPITAKRMMLEDGGLPDVEGYESLEAASYNLTMYALTQIADHGKYVIPDGMMDIGLSAKIAQMFYLKCKLCGLEEKRLRMIREWMEDLASKAPPPMPALPAAPPIVPAANIREVIHSGQPGAPPQLGAGVGAPPTQ